MEIVEHVADVELFLQSSADLVKPGGMMFVATLNRTLKSFAFGIVGAEYILRWLPRGTHEWGKFVKPSEVAAPLEASGLRVKEVRGVTYTPFKNTFSLSDDTSVNYLLRAEKKR
jgi:2-polyprenyl-6-hydroxyphenyl methylase/3-demethylubiquinone-9 3-methyltransferase